MIFHRPGPALICMAAFFVFMWIGFFKLVFWHYPRYFFTKNRKSYRFIYQYAKALDQAACAGALNGRHDETVSNKAGQMFVTHGWQAPWWCIVTKKITDKWEPFHVEKSIEPLRPDIEGD